MSLRPMEIIGVDLDPIPHILVDGFNPSEKYARQIGSLPQIGVKLKND